MAESDKIPPRRTRKVVGQLEHGLLPPQAVELEEAVLGALMLERDSLLEVVDIITEKSFYKEVHQKIYSVILELNNNSDPIDILTVTDKIKNKGWLGEITPYFITQLTNRVASTANIEYHARIIQQKYIARDVIRISSELITEAYDETHDIFELTEKMITEAYNVGDVGSKESNLSNTELITNITKKIERAKEFQGITGLKSGLLSQDKAFGGYKPGNLYIKAARIAMGKTSLILCEAHHMANVDKKNVLFFSVEMSSEQLMERLIAVHSEISLNKMASGELTKQDWEHYHKSIKELLSDNLRIVDIPNISLNVLRKIAKKHAMKYGLDCIFVDYLQLMKDTQKGNSNREQEVSRISSGLKGLAKELNVPVIALAQLSRAVENRGGGKIPQLSDLRESGSIEQDADVVQFIYRPEYYGITEDEEGNSTIGRADLINAKNRHGATGTIHVQFINHLTKFKDYEDDDFKSFDDIDSGNLKMPVGEGFDNVKPTFKHIPIESKDRKEMDDDEDLPF